MLKVLAVKVTKDPETTKVAYEKNGMLWIRSGEDGFRTGIPAQAPLKSIINKWGFYPVDNPPEFRDGNDLIDNLDGFGLQNNGTIQYSKYN